MKKNISQSVTRKPVRYENNTIMMIWIQFITCTLVILFSGKNLSKYGDIIAEKTGLGKTVIGIVLMASVTSLPELITGISSVSIFDVPNIAMGDVLGSCMFNILIIAFLDIISGPLSISTRTHQGQVLTAGFGIVLLGLVSTGIVVNARILAIGWIGIYSLAFIGLYIIAVRIVLLYEKKRMAEFVEEIAEELRYQSVSKTKAFLLYGLNALLIIGAATYLPHIGEEIAEITGLGQTFVGNIFIAVSTSLPEVVTSVAALKIGAVDMAVANLFGSNLFNIF
ncbi:MAG TPA: sodium:calcium antiporter, partial [Thermodesulfobacteriota bacterium]|nr:sodium:calcium antiporter [Thermodesulfobacteriota bacterium]